ncbi:MAG: hypothetical protein HY000_06615 [Planctomycetes bacterium]|nr:hypothetical protein [Planctomycetota bacterium]
MRKSDTQSLPSLGFLTVVEHEQHGLFGGYLVLTMGGRPLEFHCTAPVKPNRAQQILFGPTLQSYLYGEQIGQTLINKATAKPLVVCTDLGPALSVRDYISLPVAWVLPPNPGAGSDADPSHERVRFDSPHPELPGMVGLRLGRNRLAVAAGRSDDRQEIARRLEPLAETFDLAEPFARIREALEEAQRGSRAAA